LQLPNWFKILWWLVLLAILSFVLYHRYDDIIKGTSSNIDAILLIIWISLCLAPIFQEINLLGIKLKQEINKLKEDVTQQVSSLSNEVRASVRAEINPQFTFPVPPPDSQLPELEERINATIQEAIQKYGAPQQEDKDISELSVASDIQYLFATRYNIERELNRIRDSRIGRQTLKIYVPISKMIASLIEADVFDPGFGRVIKEVYAVCSPAIHGEYVSPEKTNFVKEIAPKLISILRTIS